MHQLFDPLLWNETRTLACSLTEVHYEIKGLYPGSWWAERRAWYLLFTHSRNYPLLNTCSGNSGRGTQYLHDSVIYNLASVHMHKQWILGSLFPTHWEPRYEAMVETNQLLWFQKLWASLYTSQQVLFIGYFTQIVFEDSLPFDAVSHFNPNVPGG